MRRHVIPNSLLPTITMIGVEFALLISSLVVIEQVFSLNGIGRLFLESIARSDLIVIQGIVIVLTIIFVVVNLLVDFAYALITPPHQAGLTMREVFPSPVATGLWLKPPARRYAMTRFVLGHPLGALGLALVVICVVATLIAPLIAPYDPVAADYGKAIPPPSGEHWLGTDSFGATFSAASSTADAPPF